MEKEVAITYETLFEFLRLEKGREQLQKLPETFFDDVVEYLRGKKSASEKSAKKMDLFSSTEKDKTKHQIDNTKRILKDLYERRERKIINLALVKSKTGTTALDTSVLLPIEKQMFSEMTKSLDGYRQGVLFNMFQQKLPEVKVTQKEEGQSSEPTTMTLRFLKPVPQFVGKELEPYGPFKEDDVASIPIEIASLLVEKGRAEKMN